jgi:O-antigen/teichoic acid export membrane protein
MSKALRTIFLVHSIVFVLVGALLLLLPGRFLLALDWDPIDPIVSRLLGAALLGLAWSSFRGWRATERSQVAIVLEMEAAFAALGCAGLLRHLLSDRWPLMVWGICGVLLAFAVAWIVFLVRREEGQSAA